MEEFIQINGCCYVNNKSLNKVYFAIKNDYFDDNHEDIEHNFNGQVRMVIKTCVLCVLNATYVITLPMIIAGWYLL